MGRAQKAVETVNKLRGQHADRASIMNALIQQRQETAGRAAAERKRSYHLSGRVLDNGAPLSADSMHLINSGLPSLAPTRPAHFNPYHVHPLVA